MDGGGTENSRRGCRLVLGWLAYRRRPHTQAQTPQTTAHSRPIPTLAVHFATSASVTEAMATRGGFRLQPQDAPHWPGRPPTSTIVEVTTWWASNKTSDRCDGESGKQGSAPPRRVCYRGRHAVVHAHRWRGAHACGPACVISDGGKLCAGVRHGTAALHLPRV